MVPEALAGKSPVMELKAEMAAKRKHRGKPLAMFLQWLKRVRCAPKSGNAIFMVKSRPFSSFFKQSPGQANALTADAEQLLHPGVGVCGHAAIEE